MVTIVSGIYPKQLWLSSPNGYLALSHIFIFSRKRRLNVLIMLQQNACLLVLSVSGSFVNKNAKSHFAPKRS